MNISTLLYYIDHGQLVLPHFARGFVWRPIQIRKLFRSLYRGDPFGTLILCSVDADGFSARPEVGTHCRRVDSVIDGHQRIASIYCGIRGRPTNFRPGATWSLPPLCFHLITEEFEFRKLSMKNDPFWFDLTDLGRHDARPAHFFEVLNKTPGGIARMGEFIPRLNQLYGILNRNLPVEYVPTNASLDEEVEIHFIANA